MGFYVVKTIKTDASVSVSFCSDKKNVPTQVARMKTANDTDEQFLILELQKDAKFYAFIAAPETHGGNKFKGPADTQDSFDQLKKESKNIALIQAVPYFFKNGQLQKAA